MKVLLFSNDLMPFGELPTSGGGLRCFQLMRGLESQGIEVVASMPGFTYLAEKYRDKIPEQFRNYLWRFDTQDDIYRAVRPDAVLFASNWDHFNLSVRLDVPLIIDLHGSRLIETSMWGRPASSERKVKTLAQADCLLTAGAWQRSYFYGWLVQAGRVPDLEHFIRYIPISLSPDTPKHFYPPAGEDRTPHFVSGGGWFPWQNQSRAIFAICRAIERAQKGSIEIYGSPHERQGNTAEEALIFDIYEQVKALAAKSERIKVQGYVGRNELLDIYCRASIAVEAMNYNLERELAFTTRTIEYLWCGLPVMYNNYSEISSHISDYDAGWLVDPSADESIEQAIREIVSQPEQVARKGENAQRLVRDRFAWDKTIQPLVQFLKNPVKAAEVKPVIGTVYARPAYLQVRGKTVEVPLESQIKQRFIVPAENISDIEIVLSPNSEVIPSVPGGVSFSVSNARGRLLAKRVIPASAIRSNFRAALRLPVLFRPGGGEELSCIVAPLPGSQGAYSLQCLVKSLYPLSETSGQRLVGKTEDGAQELAFGLALSFVPEDYNSLYQLKVLIRRGVVMLKQGEWKRLLRAVQKRVRGFVYAIRRRTVGALSGG